jgi:CHAT domain-containing protein/Tfp pilus assembly protein PilF
LVKKYNAMRKVIILIALLCIAGSAFSQSRQELVDSTYFYKDKRDYETALKWAFKAEAATKEEKGEADSTYMVAVRNLSEIYFFLGNLDMNIFYAEKNLAVCRKIFSDTHLDLAKAINDLGLFYKTKGDYSKAEPLYIEALEKYKKIYPGDNSNLAISINNMAVLYFDMGNLAKAEPYYDESLKMRRRIFTTDHKDIAESLGNNATFYDKRGDYEKAEQMFIESMEMKRRLYKSDDLNLAIGLGNLGSFLSDRRKFEKAEDLLVEACDMFRRIYKTDNINIAQSISGLAFFYERKSEYAKAENYFKEALEMRRRLHKADHPGLAMAINYLATFYNRRNEFAKAEPLFVEALEMYRRIFKTYHPDLAACLNHISTFYMRQGNYLKAEPFILEGLNIYAKILNSYFPSLSEKEKKEFWTTISKNFERFNTFACERQKDNSSILSNMYDYQLYTKAILLNSSTRIKKRIMQSGDSVLKQLYQNWVGIKLSLVKYYKMSNIELNRRKINIDSVEQVANDLEKQITIKSEDFKNSYENKKINWKSVQTLLKPDEAAIEIVRFRYWLDGRLTDTINYAFLIISEQTEDNPELVLIENGKELENEFYKDYISKTKSKKTDILSYERYWAKVEDKIKSFKRIYLSADGVYNKINPSTFLIKEGKYLQEIHEIQQVNSTKDIILDYYQNKQESNIYNSAVLIGNPNFSLSEAEVKKINKSLKKEIKEEYSSEEIVSLRGITLSQLPGTESEIKHIERFLKSKNWVVKIFLGDKAVKRAVKTAENPRVLHIATHGLFLDDGKKGGSELFGFNEKKMTDNPLLRSGLFFTGADNYLNSDKTVNTADDDNGLLTAYEAMNLDLDKTELVVLSACETGLGEIQNGEGVFGLRRAFQQAGARTILMSLWKVNDDATQELMTAFYSNWVDGMTKRAAFAKAQQTVRNKYPEPYYWGAFVMIGD